MKRRKEIRRDPNYRMPRRAMPKRGKRIARRPRAPEDFARIYGSDERVAWVKAQPCAYCGRGPCDNAHTVSGGKGRKADHPTIAPLCSGPEGCHWKYDRHLAPFTTRAVRSRIIAAAAETERRWQAYTNRSEAA